MYAIDADEMSQPFFACWQAAGLHLDRQVDGGIRSWMRSHATPPFLEHLSFRLGNQLFFIMVEDVDGLVRGPGSGAGHRLVAHKTGGHAAIMPMRRAVDGNWHATVPGWGLLEADSGRLLNPVELVTDERIAMTTWELQDFAVQIVRDRIETDGFKVLSWQPNPAVDPSIFFVGDSGRREWVVVRVATYPRETAQPPDDLVELLSLPALRDDRAHFASVGLVTVEQLMQADDNTVVPLWRGHPADALYDGLEPLS